MTFGEAGLRWLVLANCRVPWRGIEQHGTKSFQRGRQSHKFPGRYLSRGAEPPPFLCTPGVLFCGMLEWLSGLPERKDLSVRIGLKIGRDVLTA